MIISKLPKPIQDKIRRNTDLINTFNSSDLLNYSKALRQQKSEIGINVYNHLLSAIDERRDAINNDSITKLKCNDSEMIKQFVKDRR